MQIVCYYSRCSKSLEQPADRRKTVVNLNLLQVQETTAGPGLHNRHFKYTATGGTFMAKIAKADRTIAQEGILDNFFAEKTGLEVHTKHTALCRSDVPSDTQEIGAQREAG